MKNIILTRNVFICHAFQEILNEYKCKDICVVDIDSYHSLHELLQVMKDANLYRDQKVYFLKGISVLSKILVSITAFHVLDSLLRLKKVIRTARVPNYAFAVKYIRSYTKLSMMTDKEKLIAQKLLNYRDVTSMARAMKLNHKTLYSRVRIMAIKLNLRDVGQMRKFICCEMAAINSM
ncbi:hypothetical protein [Enterobacter quasiroggenkampii]|uniref:hypothetical protein n=1 Tax=Enterobacter quasiroggenkampii TaxID=2497436 RepID=UPI0020061F11|nr:hypothetical protein [Enterobacter quasiroggenkampii]MCK7310401.1 hypothetical protein [Enterobacter quasiroggenkampii]